MRDFDRRTTGDVEAALMSSLRQARQRAPAAGELAELIPPFPLKVQVQTWTRCNAACAMCPYPEITSEAGFEHERMSEAVYQSLLDQLAGQPIERFSPFLMNEPLLDKRLPDWIRRARKALPQTTIGLFSNGAALTPRLAMALAEAGLDELCVSVHGFDPAVNRAVMGDLDHGRIIANLDAIAPMLDDGRLGPMHLQLVMGDLPQLTDTLPLAPPRLTKLVTLKAFSNEREVSAVPTGLPSSASSSHTRSATGLGEANSEPRAPLCQRPFVKLYVMANGDCVACNCDWRRREVLGNLKAQSVETIWRGAAYRQLREAQIEGRFTAGHLCRACDYPLVVDEL